MGAVYAAVGDIEKFRTLTAQEREQTETLLEAASAKLRITGKEYGCNIDGMIADDDDLAVAVRSVVVQAVIRALGSISDSPTTVAQASQSGLGYSASVTYVNAGQSLYFLKNELKELGVMRQKYGAMEVYGSAVDKGNGS